MRFKATAVWMCNRYCFPKQKLPNYSFLVTVWVPPSHWVASPRYYLDVSLNLTLIFRPIQSSLRPTTFPVRTCHLLVEEYLVFVAVHNNLVTVEEKRFDVKGPEVTAVSVQFDKTRKLYSPSYYHPPTQDRSSLDLVHNVITRGRDQVSGTRNDGLTSCKVVTLVVVSG